MRFKFKCVKIRLSKTETSMSFKSKHSVYYLTNWGGIFMTNFIVMQGRTFQKEKNEELLWAPKWDRSEKKQHSWERMRDVRCGDITFHYKRGEIVAISQAQSDCMHGDKPHSLRNYDEWNVEGYLVKTKYWELDTPISIKENWSQIEPLLPVKYSAFKKNGDGNEGYLFPCNDELTVLLFELISQVNDFSINNPDLTKDPLRGELFDEIRRTEGEIKQKVRYGQGKFKEDLLEFWGHKCALCNITRRDLLRASHSKAWKDSDDVERLDKHNGILLCCNHDVLYDKGFITFDSIGRIMISERILMDEYKEYGLSLDQSIDVSDNHQVYLKWHRKAVFK